MVLRFQARILLEPLSAAPGENLQSYDEYTSNTENMLDPPGVPPVADTSSQEGYVNQGQEIASREEKFGKFIDLRAKSLPDETDKETNIHDGDMSCLATGTASDIDDDQLKGSYSYDMEDGYDVEHGSLTSCVGTRWFRAPELLYGSTSYGLEVDLWSLGCIFAELLTLEPLFPGNSDIDQLARIFNVLGNLTEEVWPGCSKLPDYRTISFTKIESPMGLEACLPNRSPAEIAIVKRLLCYDPTSRATPMELLQDRYFFEESLPVPISELQVPLTRSGRDEDSSGQWRDYNDLDSDSDFDDFGPCNVTTTSSGFSIQFQ